MATTRTTRRPASKAVKQPTDRLGKTARSVTVGIYLDEVPADAHDRAVATLKTAETKAESTRERRIAQHRMAMGTSGLDLEEAAKVVALVDAAIDAELAPLRSAVDDALAALDAATRWFTFRSLGRRRWRELLDEHPPREEDHEQAKALGSEKAGWNGDTLPRALLAAAGDITEPEVADIFDGDAWTDLEVGTLVNAAISAQLQARYVDHRPAPRP